VAIGKTVTPTFLFTLLLYGPIAQYIERQPPEKWHDVATILEGCDYAVRAAQQQVQIPKRFALGLRDMYALQPRLENPRGRRALKLIEQPRFRAAFDLLLIRAQVGMAPKEAAEWWTHVQEASAEERERIADRLDRHASRRSEGGGGGGSGSGSGGGGSGRRPRRRRRRPSGGE
jgi:poly(A) polymerase